MPKVEISATTRFRSIGTAARFQLSASRSSEADALALASDLRAADRQEIRAASGLTPEAALRRSWAFSTHVWAARDGEGRPIALWGVGPLSLVGGRGCPWLLASDAFEQFGREIGRQSRKRLADIRRLYPELENRVDARHMKAIRWLAWLGFTIDPPAPWGIEGRPFHRFWL